MFVTGHNGDDVNEYKLTIGFDISTATFVDSFDTESEDNDSRDVKFNQNGTKMFVLGKQNDRVCEYTLSTGFDVSSTVTFVDCASVSEESMPDELEFNPDGTKMFVMGESGDDVNEYTLRTGFDVSTATFVDSFSITDQDDEPGSLAFSSDGSKLFLLGRENNKVYEYSLTCYYGVINCMDPTSDKDDVASVEAQTESAKQLIQHTTFPVLNRMEWLRRNKNNSNLTNQNIKFHFADEILTSLSNLIIPASLNSNNSTSTVSQSSNWSYWSEGEVSIGKIRDTLTSSAKNISTTAITIGVDKRTDNNRMFGLALRFGIDDIDIGISKNSLDIDAVSLTLYETRPQGEDIFIDSLLGIGSFKTDIVNAVGSSSTKGKRDGKQIFSSFKIRETFKKNKLNFTPNIKLDLGFTSLSDYSESGSTNLKFDRQNIGTIITYIGGTLDSSSNLRNGTFKPYFEYDYFADISPSSEQKISYISDTSSTYTLTNINSSTHNFMSKLGFDFITDSGWDFTSSYQRTQNKEYGYNDAFNFGVNYISRKNIEYAMFLDNNKVFIDYKRKINGFDITFGSNYSLMSAILDYDAILKVSSKF